jgi:asparagine synthase (glutamine-hydrolysing)
MSGQAPDRVRTFSIGFNDKAFDESAYAAQVAAQYKTRHQSEVVDAKSLSLIDRLPAIFDEPFGDASAIPTFQVCAHARKGVKVCLSGDGGDEALAGYRRYRFFQSQQAIRSLLPSRLRATVFGWAAQNYPKLDRAPSWMRAKTTLGELAVDDAEAFFLMNCAVPDAARATLYSGDLRRELHGYSGADVIRAKFRESEGDTSLRRAQYTDITTYLPGDILVKVDRTSMANSLEVRPPFLDPEFVAWSYALPDQAKLRKGQGKALLKQAMRPFLPNDLIDRPKMGFSMPIADWLRTDLRSDVEALGRNSHLANSGLVDSSVVQRLAREHLSGAFNHARPLWLIFVFAAFLKHAASQAAVLPQPAVA